MFIVNAGAVFFVLQIQEQLSVLQFIGYEHRGRAVNAGDLYRLHGVLMIGKYDGDGHGAIHGRLNGVLPGAGFIYRDVMAIDGCRYSADRRKFAGDMQLIDRIRRDCGGKLPDADLRSNKQHRKQEKQYHNHNQHQPLQGKTLPTVVAVGGKHLQWNLVGLHITGFENIFQHLLGNLIIQRRDICFFAFI